MSLEKRSIQYGAIFGDWHIQQMLGSGSGGKSAVFEIYRDNKGWIEHNALKAVSLIEEQGNPEVFSPYRMKEYSTAAQNHRKKAEQEVRLMEQLRGKTNIVDYLDHQFFEWRDETGFGVDLLIRMEKLSDLRNELKNRRAFSEEEIIQLGKDMCHALIICHKKNILHRDIKPENIFFNSDGDYKLGDFGISRIMSESASAMASTGIGTAAYSAPEQFAGAYDKRVDIYSLGLVLYEMANGNKLPFAQSSYVSQGEIQLRLSGAALPVPEGVSEALAKVILKACAFKAEDRYSSAEELLRGLENLGEEDSYATAAVFPPSQPADPYKTAPARDNEKPGIIGAGIGMYDTTPATETVNLPKGHADRTQRSGGRNNKAEGKKNLIKWIIPAALIIIILLLLWLMLSLLFSLLFKHEHVWQEATCTSPEVCADCGETRGSPLGHTWTNVSCTDPRICAECGVSSDSSPGHQWRAATYQTPQTCGVCGQTEGVSLSDPWKRKPVNTPTGIIGVAAGGWTTYVLTDQGTVCGIGRNQDGQKDVGHFYDVVDIAAGDRHVAMLHEDGTVSAIGRYDNGQCRVNSWEDIIDVCADVNCTVGICADGTVKLAGGSQFVDFDVSDWTDIVQVDATDHFIVGLRADGTVVHTGGSGHEEEDNFFEYNRNGKADEVAQWTDITAVATGQYHIIGLRKDGTVVATRPAANEYPRACDVSGWTDIVAIAAGEGFSVGLRADGTVVVAGDFTDKDKISKWKGSIADVRSWRNIIQISAMYNQIIGLTEDGRVVACGFNTYGQCDAENIHKEIFGRNR